MTSGGERYRKWGRASRHRQQNALEALAGAHKLSSHFTRECQRLSSATPALAVSSRLRRAVDRRQL